MLTILLLWALASEAPHPAGRSIPVVAVYTVSNHHLEA